MRAVAGQALRRSGRLIHAAFQLALALVVIASLGFGLLAWRLSTGPIELPWLVARLEAAVNNDTNPTRLSIGSAQLAWEGFTQGVDRPIDIRVTDIAAFDIAGARIAHIPSAEISLSAGWLLLGRMVPRAIDLHGVELRMLRAPDGSVTLDLGSLMESIDEAAADATVQAGPQDAQALAQAVLAELAQAPQRDRDLRSSGWSQLRRVRIRDSSATIVDRAIGVTWRATGVTLDMQRHTDGGVDGGGHATLAAGDQTARLDLTFGMPPARAPNTSAPKARLPGTVTLTARLSPIRPSALATLSPSLTRLAALNVPIGVEATAELTGDAATSRLRMTTTVGGGILHIARGTMPILNARIEADLTAQALEVKLVQMQTAARADGPRSTIKASMSGRRDGSMFRARAIIDLDRADFADLPTLWPRGLGGPGTQPWITENITKGTATDGHFEIELLAPADFSDVEVTRLAGGIAGHDITVAWLAPIPPVEHVEAQMSFAGPDVIEITAQGGRQAGTALTMRTAKMRIYGLTVRDQLADVEGDMSGPVADLLTLLRHPKLKLLDRRPIAVTNPAGQVSGHLALTHIPLEFKVSLDDIAIRARGRATDVRLGSIAVGRDLTQGSADIEASNEGLRVKGAALVGGIPTQLQVDMDFRDGPPSQIVQKIAVSGTTDAKGLAGAGIDTYGYLPGSVGLQVNVQTRRDDRGEVTVQADFGRTALAFDRLNWKKPASSAAHGELHLLYDRDRVTAIDRLTLQGEAIDVRTALQFTAGQPTALRFERFKLGAITDLQGDLQFPAKPGAPWIARLAGASLDASSQFERKANPTRKSAEDERGPSYILDLKLDRVRMAAGHDITGVIARVETDGLITNRMHVSGKTSGAAGFALDISPQPGGRTRHLAAQSSDAGGMLRALDIIPDMQGGQMSVSGTYDDARADHALSGSAEITDFRMRNAPALGKLLQAMTLYGLVEAVQGQGLGFNRLVAPFRLAQDRLDLDNARAFSASLGMTAKGQLDLASNACEIQGTIVPAYFFNTLLGRIPLVGRLFSPETGGGLFAATYGMHGNCNDPDIAVNPLAVLTPGFLRGMFDIFDVPAGAPRPAPSPSASGGDR